MKLFINILNPKYHHETKEAFSLFSTDRMKCFFLRCLLQHEQVKYAFSFGPNVLLLCKFLQLTKLIKITSFKTCILVLVITNPS